ncbi:MAG: serine kinase [Firmicutes bacterium]|nr:serine kinase [Bacillota bacterium]
MKVKELIDQLGLEVMAGPFNREVTGVYVGDLLSNVMAKAKAGDLWITVQGHLNVVAVASLTEVAAIVVVEDFELEPEAVKRAEEKEVNILRTPLTASELMRKLIELGL